MGWNVKKRREVGKCMEGLKERNEKSEGTTLVTVN
jgi:hypothetical protein